MFPDGTHSTHLKNYLNSLSLHFVALYLPTPFHPLPCLLEDLKMEFLMYLSYLIPSTGIHILIPDRYIHPSQLVNSPSFNPNQCCINRKTNFIHRLRKSMYGTKQPRIITGMYRIRLFLVLQIGGGSIFPGLLSKCFPYTSLAYLSTLLVT